MTKLYYRGMMADNGKPKIGRHARCLGIRPNTELGILLYQRLRSAPAFRYGIVGVEVDEFRTYSELIDDGTVVSLPGIVIDRDIWQLLESPSILRSFATDYFWKPYEGEVYKPLVTSSELKTKMSELLMAA